MIFKRELAEKVVAGEKTVTRRACSENPRSPWWRERCTYQPGKVFTVNPGRGVARIGEARVVKCERMRLGYLTDAEARAEGVENATVFREVFEAINGSYDPDLMVWRVEFEAL
jgi:hypothetical protein